MDSDGVFLHDRLFRSYHIIIVVFCKKQELFLKKKEFIILMKYASEFKNFPYAIFTRSGAHGAIKNGEFTA